MKFQSVNHKKKSQTKSQRQLQIGENIKRIMSEIFMREDILAVPNTQIVVREADVSPDAKSVKIFVSLFGNDSIHEKIVAQLNKVNAHFRYQLAKKITLRFTPEISFVLDKAEKYASEIEALINKEAQALKEAKITKIKTIKTVKVAKQNSTKSAKKLVKELTKKPTSKPKTAKKIVKKVAVKSKTKI